MRIGVPLPRGALTAPDRLTALDEDGCRVPWQGRVLALWPDRSVKWMLADLVVRGGDSPRRTIFLLDDEEAPASGILHVEPLQARTTATAIIVRAGACEFEFSHTAAALVASVRSDGRPLLDNDGLVLALRDAAGVQRHARISRLAVEHAGPVRIDLVADGRFDGKPACPLEFRTRFAFVATSPHGFVCETRIRNPRSARHVGGLWDLGDEGSWRIGDLSLRARSALPFEGIEWREHAAGEVRRSGATTWCLYQDSSGGVRWDSPNHVDASGRPTVRFRGYEVRVAEGASSETVARGDRAQPYVMARGAGAAISMSVEDFWENFPKALRLRDNAIEVGLFPAEAAGEVELQGGEQKRHAVRIDFGTVDRACEPAGWLEQPHVWIDPSWIEASRAVPGMKVDLDAAREAAACVTAIVEGPDSFVARRERIDEYGWRNFGDLYADHEAVHHKGSDPFISHYNNQYDFVWGAGVHALRTGDQRWWKLMRDAARHTVDIDVYHTKADKSAFNGGLFWHTEHYVPARTATHRAYSRHNALGAQSGGGPSNEHNYATGLLLHHCVSGDPDAREVVLGLADWVIAMDDGARTVFGVLDAGPTGIASATSDPDYHGPGRGAGNSIATLLDAYVLTFDRVYLSKAEELIRRCVHPHDEVRSHSLDEPERRWSYLVFLQALGRYLDAKRELDEVDFGFHYARESLLRYADWMLEHEVPYRDVLHKVELPTETWPAHDIRKCHVMHLAAIYDHRGRREAFREKASFFYQRCLSDLATFPTRNLTRPLVILCVYGHLHAYYQGLAQHAGAADGWVHNHDFGVPSRFVSQRARAIRSFRSRLRVAIGQSRRLFDDRIRGWRRRPRGGGA